MKNLITIILLMFAFVANAQDITLLHINAKWNTSNDYNLRGIRHAKVLMVNLEDQSAELIIGKDGKPKGQWQADLSFKLTVPRQEIQDRINILLFGESKN